MSTLIHIGWPKTGTSTLQGHVFPAFGGTDLVGPKSQLFYRFTQNLIQADDEDYLEATWRGFIADARQRLPALIISREDLTKDGRTERIARRLHELLPEAHILACVRNQRTLIPSFYGQHLKDGCPQRFDQWLSENVPRRWQYDTGIEHFQARFGADRVTVLAYEQLVEDPAAFAAAVYATILEGEAQPAEALPTTNRMASRTTRWALRRMNRLFRRSAWQRRPLVIQLPVRLFRFATAALDAATPWANSQVLSPRDAAQLEQVLPCYQESNARLEALTGLDLGRYGYPLPPSRSAAASVASAVPSAAP